MLMKKGNIWKIKIADYINEILWRRFNDFI